MKNKKLPVILWVGDGGCATGFARVNHSIINNLPENKYEVHHLAINYKGDPYPEAKAPMYPAFLGGDLYGLKRLGPMIDKLKPDLIFILNDTWIINQYLSAIPEDIKVVVYFPVDAKPLRKEWCEPIVERTTPVAYTNYGKSAILDFFEDTRVKVIPHGIDTNIFYPIDMSDARSHLQGVTNKDFIVLNANRNQPRKRFDLTIKGFAKFAKGKPQNVKLYCHCGVEDQGFHVIAMCERYHIESRLLLTSLDLSPANGVDDERLNWIYNACDIGLNTSMGEGWSLTVFEQAACRKAQLMPRHSALIELYDDISNLMPIHHWDTYPGILTEGAVVSVDSIAEGLEYLYTHPKERKEQAEKIYSFVTQDKFQWKEIAKKWSNLFDELLDKEKK